MEEPSRELILGNPVLLVIDIQRDWAMPAAQAGITRMDGHEEVVGRAERLVAAARTTEVPIVFFQEAHRRSGVDFGRELDGDEGPHCLEGEPGTDLWPTLVPGPGEHHIVKRRYSGFFGTDLSILLQGLHADTLVLIGALTDVCVHYTFVDAHQHDYHVRVVEDCVIGSSPARHAAALDAMEYLQHGARCTTDQALGALAAVGGQPGAFLVEVGQ
ncbi:MAG TPA: isochorismatase family cysteine hydrolase [Acidimicrobiales bacterium]|nr:isochorismatase family cysteine hydrolase [Acidimicrobiales bacterium]